MGNDDDLTPVLEDLENAESLEELQTHVLVATEYFEARPSIDRLEMADDAEPAVVDDLERWLTRLRERTEDLASAQGAASFTISLHGDLTGPSISISVTFQLDASVDPAIK